MQKYNVSQLVKGVIGTSKEVVVDGQPDCEGLELDKATGKLKLTKTINSILVKGHIETKVVLECARCLNRFEYDMKFDVEDEFYISNALKYSNLEQMGYYTDEVEEEDHDEDDTLVVDEHMQVDLDELIRQYVLMNIPMKPLCDPNCKGTV